MLNCHVQNVKFFPKNFRPGKSVAQIGLDLVHKVSYNTKSCPKLSQLFKKTRNSSLVIITLYHVMLYSEFSLTKDII